MELKKLSALEISEKIRNREITAKQVVDSIYENINRIDTELNCFINLTPELAYKQAEKIDDAVSKNQNISVLAGVPVGIKDNICIKNVKTTCGSKMLENFVSPYNATVIEKMNDAGMIFIGKMNMDEFAMGSSNETSYFKPVKNPWNTKKIPGGSSGGSAASVAARLVPLTLGSDTGGSIRQPAALCGVSGIKPTYGKVSRYGLVAFASSLDQIGIFSNNIKDNCALMNIISGYDKKDSTSINIETENYLKNLSSDIKGSRIGIPKEYFASALSENMKNTISNAIQKFETELGCETVEISLPHTDYAVSVYYILATAEASSNLARFDGVKYGYRTKKFTNLIDMYKNTRDEGFGEEVKRRIMLGTYALSSGYYDAYYKKAQKVRTLIKQDFNEAFKKCDIILTPTSPTVAFDLGSKLDNPLDMYLSDIFTISVNLAGIPAMSVPCGLINGLPAGLQIIGNNFCEQKIYNTAFAFEQLNNKEYIPETI